MQPNKDASPSSPCAPVFVWMWMEAADKLESRHVDDAHKMKLHMYDLLAHLNANAYCIEIKWERWKCRKVILNFQHNSCRRHRSSTALVGTVVYFSILITISIFHFPHSQCHTVHTHISHMDRGGSRGITTRYGARPNDCVTKCLLQRTNHFYRFVAIKLSQISNGIGFNGKN